MDLWKKASADVEWTQFIGFVLLVTVESFKLFYQLFLRWKEVTIGHQNTCHCTAHEEWHRPCSKAVLWCIFSALLHYSLTNWQNFSDFNGAKSILRNDGSQQNWFSKPSVTVKLMALSYSLFLQWNVMGYWSHTQVEILFYLGELSINIKNWSLKVLEVRMDVVVTKVTPFMSIVWSVLMH